MEQLLEIYGIELKRYETFMTSDSGSNMVKAYEKACFNQITCIGHDSHLAIQKTIRSVRDIHAAFHSGSNIVAYIKRNGVAKEKLKKIVKLADGAIKCDPVRFDSLELVLASRSTPARIGVRHCLDGG